MSLPHLLGSSRRHRITVCAAVPARAMVDSETRLVMPETTTWPIGPHSLCRCYKVGSVVSNPWSCRSRWFWTLPDLCLSFPLIVSFLSLSHHFPLCHLFLLSRLSAALMGLGRLAGLASVSLALMAVAEDLLFYDEMTYQEYTRATTVLGYTGRFGLRQVNVHSR